MKILLARISLVLLFGAGLMALNAQDKQAPANPQAAVAQQQNDTAAQDAKPYSGTLVKEKGKLVLKDEATNMRYQLDDQEKAKPFEGKQVKVTGKLDMDANLIHVQSIEAVS